MELHPKPYEGKEDVESFTWPDDKRAAVSFTFDDSRSSQARVASPRLSDLGIRATFYVLPGAVSEELDAWRAVVERGHEIGHHSKLHPCARDLNASKVFLEDYTLERLETEIREAAEQLAELLSVRPKSFAYPCGNTYVGAGEAKRSYVPLIAELFQTGRGYPHSVGNNPHSCNMEYLRSSKLDNVSFDTARRLVDEAVADGTWLLFTAHETPEEDPVLTELSRYVLDRGDVWIDTVTPIAEYVLSHR
jgi:peptidoglycan/xylan/chitin deacetylase (PgdA/CDA1 family)